MNLKATLLRAGAWTAGAYALELVVRLISNLILTRLLFPEAFGLVAASSSILIGLALISDFGIRAAIIQNPDGERKKFLRSAWSFQISRGAVLWLVLVLFCGVISLPPIHDCIPAHSVFSSSTFPALTVVLGLGLLIDGFESTAVALNYRRMNYGAVICLDLIGKITPVPTTIVCAWLYPSPWALAVGALTASLVRLALSHTIVPGPRMRWEWDPPYIRQIIHFGKWITIASIATFVSSQADVILFGLLLPGAFVGVYFVAKTLVDAIDGLIEKLNVTLTLPLMGAVLRQNPLNLRDRFYRFRLPIDFVAVVSSGFLFVSGNQIISILYDPRYSQAGDILQLLALGLAIQPLQLIRSAFTAIGKTNVPAVVSVLYALSLISFLAIGFFLSGAMGAIAGIALSRLVPAIALFFLARTREWTSGWRELRLIPLFALGLGLGEAFLFAIEKSKFVPHIIR